MSRRHGRPPNADLPYRPCVGIALFNRDGLVFLGRRRQDAGPEHVDADGRSWQMPQGGINPGEEPYAAALRELYEETSVSSVEFLAEAPDWYTYDLPAPIAGQVWRGRYRGQMQRWFAFRFTGSDDEIEIASPGGGRHKAEFDGWRWEPLRNLPGLIIPFKRPVYENVVAAFGHLAGAAE
ncbi:RNA pyrophosphohydrolase [uncultured Enterovirga sp.]|uniref:RNA pyrophosphohydrolase n=1 Tax=uncultured Enterovirga sp. TaxID=2026352 RepID=UPI0035C9F9EC